MNCVIIDDNKMARSVLAEMLSAIDFVTIVGNCESLFEAITILENNKVDLLFLDVEMPKMSGIDFLKNTIHRPLVILITAKSEYAIEAFEYNVVDYLLKPVDEGRLLKSLLRAKELFESKSLLIDSPTKEFLFVREKNVLEKILVSDILYIQALGDYLIIFTNIRKHTIHLTLKSFLQRFKETNLIRIHRSYIIAVNKIDRVEESTAYIGKTPIPIGSIYRNELLKKINVI